jgi:isoamylase
MSLCCALTLDDGRLRIVDTNLAPPKDFTVGGNKGVDAVYTLAPFSSILLVAKPSSS